MQVEVAWQAAQTALSTANTARQARDVIPFTDIAQTMAWLLERKPTATSSTPFNTPADAGSRGSISEPSATSPRRAPQPPNTGDTEASAALAAAEQRATEFERMWKAARAERDKLKHDADASAQQAATAKSEAQSAMRQLEMCQAELHAAQDAAARAEQLTAALQTDNARLTGAVMAAKRDAAEQMNSFNDSIERLKAELAAAKEAQHTRSAGAAAASAAAVATPGSDSSPSVVPSSDTGELPMPTHVLATWVAHRGDVHAAVFTDAGTGVVTAGADGCVGIWSAPNGSQRAMLEPCTGQALYDVAVCRDRLACGGASRTGYVWALAGSGGREIGQLGGHTGKITGVQLVVGGAAVVTSSADRVLRLFDLRVKGSPCIRKVATPSIIHHMAVTPDGLGVYTGHQDGCVRLWDMKSGRAQAVAETKPAHLGGITSISLSEDGGTLMSSGRDNRMLTFRASNLALAGANAGVESPTSRARAASGGSSLLSWGWRKMASAGVVPSEPALDPREAAAMSGTGVAVPYAWSRAALTCRGRSDDPATPASAMFAALGDKTGCVQVWDARTYAQCSTVRLPKPARGGTAYGVCASWAPVAVQGASLVLGDSAGRVHLLGVPP